MLFGKKGGIVSSVYWWSSFLRRGFAGSFVIIERSGGENPAGTKNKIGKSFIVAGLNL